MKKGKELLCILTIMLGFNCYAQILFEKGYYINNTNERVDCFIKNIDWRNNPTDFEYKLSETAESQKASIVSVKEFGIDNFSKYIRSTVKIDRSGKQIKYLSNDKSPEFQDEELFLKVLVEGKASLYLFEDRGLIRYFFSTKNVTTEQLIFKLYKISTFKISENNTFKNQLRKNLKCSVLEKNTIKNLEYQKNDLIDFFVEYNECSGGKQVNFDAKQKRDLFNLNIRPGVNISSLSLLHDRIDKDLKLDNQVIFRLGVEAEFILPFNKNKWSVIVEPTYKHFESKQKVGSYNLDVDYKSVELPVGLRHYFFLNDDSKVFVNGSYVVSFAYDSMIDLNLSEEEPLKIYNGHNLSFGMGYKYKDKYSLELRYQTSRNIIRNYIEWNSIYRNVSLTFGYSLF